MRVCAATAVGGHVLVWGPRARVESGEMRTGPGARCCALQERPGQRLSDGGGVQTPGAESSAPGRGMNATVSCCFEGGGRGCEAYRRQALPAERLFFKWCFNR